MLDVGDVFWAVLGDLEAEDQERARAVAMASAGRSASGKAAVAALAERRAGGHPRPFHPHYQQQQGGDVGVGKDDGEAKGADLEESGRGTVKLDDKEEDEDEELLYGDAAQDIEAGTGRP